jgi:hypothetical protein
VKVGDLVRQISDTAIGFQPDSDVLGVVVEVKISEPSRFTTYRILWLDSQKYTTHWSTKWLEVVDA